jgi:hypothetical protein
MNNPHPTITIDLVRHSFTPLYPLKSVTQVLDRHTTKEVLQAVLHAILFHRLFGLVKPQTFDVLDVTMVREQLVLTLLVRLFDLRTARRVGPGDGAACERESRCVLAGCRGWSQQARPGPIHSLLMSFQKI